MRRVLGAVFVVSVFAFDGAGLHAITEFPSWAYGQLTPPPGTAPAAAPAAPAGGAPAGRPGEAAPAPAPDQALHSVPGQRSAVQP